MTTEDHFQQLLDANPEDHATRLVFADWLQDRDDPRAEGYRALGMMERQAWYFNGSRDWGWFEKDWCENSDNVKRTASAMLPLDWFQSHTVRGGKNRRDAEDVAALAFARLPEARRAELLNPVPAAA